MGALHGKPASNVRGLFRWQQILRGLMPTISAFYGILIQMFWNDHAPPRLGASVGVGAGTPRRIDGRLATMRTQSIPQENPAACLTPSVQPRMPWRVASVQALPLRQQSGSAPVFLRRYFFPIQFVNIFLKVFIGFSNTLPATNDSPVSVMP